MNVSLFHPGFTRSVWLLLLFPVLAIAQGQPSLVQVPFVNVAIGVPAATYNGTTATACAQSTPGFQNSLGDGCPASQALLKYPDGVAIDSLDNIYVADLSNNRVRVLFKRGAALSAALVAANPRFSFTPVAGNVYAFGMGAAALTATNGTYYCIGSSGQVALDSLGDGCAAQYASVPNPRNVAVDADGNVFIVQGSLGASNVRVVYVAGTAAARLITTYNPSVTNPQPGYIYGLSIAGDFDLTYDIAIDSSENLYVADSASSQVATPAPNETQATTYGNQIKKFTGTGWVTYLAHNCTGCSQPGAYGDGGPVTQASLNGPHALLFDSNDNLYFSDSSAAPGRVRVVYHQGTTPPLYINTIASGGAITVTPVTAPVAGYVYTVAGGQPASGSRMTGSLASALTLNGAPEIGLDRGGDLYMVDGLSVLWRVNLTTGVAMVLGGEGASTTVGSASTSPKAGVACNGASGGPLMMDAYADGCPATQVSSITPMGHIAFDSAGNFYLSEARVTSAPVGVLREYSFSNHFESVPVGSSATKSAAFTPGSSHAVSATPEAGYTLMGAPTTEFYGAGGDLCSTTTGTATVQTCIVNIGFTPLLAGSRLGGLSLTSSGTALAAIPVGGVGAGAQIAIDPASQTTFGSTFAPSGTGVGAGSDAYLADATTGALYKTASGSSLTQVASGFSQPGQVAVDGTGNIYVADAGNNRVAVVTAGNATTLLSSFDSLSLSAPTGVATDIYGNVFVSDTGNNRILKLTPEGGILLVSVSGLNAPQGLAIDSAGDLFVADSGNGRIVELTAAGVQSSVSIAPALTTPVAVAVDPAGNLYVADAGSQSVVEIPNGSSAAVSLAGSISGLKGLAIDSTGDLYVAATGNSGLLQLNRTQVQQSFPITNGGQSSDLAFNLISTGNMAWTSGTSLTSETDTVNFSVASASTNGCSTTASLQPGQDCGLVVTFQPQAIGTSTNTLTFPGSNAVDAASITLTGKALTVPTGTSSIALSVVSPTGTITFGESVVISAIITTSNATAVPTGTVHFAVDGVTQSSVPYAPTLSVTLTLPGGAHTVTANYSGDTQYGPSTQTLSFTVVRATPVVVLETRPNVASTGNTITLTANVASPAGSPTGAVTFSYGSTVLGTVPLANGAATYTISTNALGSYAFSAAYSGDDNFQPFTTTVTPDPDFAITVDSDTASVPQGGTAQYTVHINAFYGYTGAVTFSCTGITNGVCGGFPAVATVPVDGVTTAQLQVVTNATPNIAALLSPRGPLGRTGLIAFAGSLLLCFSSLRRRKHWLRGAVLILSVAILSSLTGCGSDTRLTTTNVTPAGTVTLNVSATDGKIVHTFALTLTVINAPSTGGRP